MAALNILMLMPKFQNFFISFSVLKKYSYLLEIWHLSYIYELVSEFYCLFNTTKTTFFYLKFTASIKLRFCI